MRSAAITPSRKRTGSLSARSSDSHANGGAPGAARHSASSVVLPDPTGACTSTSRAYADALRRPESRFRGTRPEGAAGIWIFVAARIAPEGADRAAVDGSVAMPGAPGGTGTGSSRPYPGPPRATAARGQAPLRRPAATSSYASPVATA